MGDSKTRLLRISLSTFDKTPQKVNHMRRSTLQTLRWASVDQIFICTFRSLVLRTVTCEQESVQPLLMFNWRPKVCTQHNWHRGLSVQKFGFYLFHNTSLPNFVKTWFPLKSPRRAALTLQRGRNRQVSFRCCEWESFRPSVCASCPPSPEVRLQPATGWSSTRTICSAKS